MTEPRLAENIPADPDPEPQPDADGETTSWMRRLAAAESEIDDDDEYGDSDGVAPLASGTLLTLGVLWLAATMWSAHAEMAGGLADASVVLSSAALALPGTVAASLMAGAAAGLVAAGRFGPAWAGRRLTAGLTAGGVCGALAAGAILLSYGGGWSVGVLAITIGLAGLVGGAAVTVGLSTLAAGVAATLGVFVTGVLLSLFQPQLTALLGAGDTIASRADAVRMYVYLAAFTSGLVAGLIAYLFVRRRGPDLRWPAYLVAGGFAGVLLLTAEVLTRLGGARLLGLVGQLSAVDRASLIYAGGARVTSALIVGFVGALTAMIAFGRTLRRPV
jgi:hypothetical protein